MDCAEALEIVTTEREIPVVVDLKALVPAPEIDLLEGL